MSFECTGYSGNRRRTDTILSGSHGSQLAVEFKKNQTSSPLSGNITFDFKDPAGSAKTLSDVIAFTQQPAEYRIRFEQSNVDLASAGGTQALSVVYEDRTGPVALTYKSAAGLPEGWSITPGANGQLTLSYGKPTASLRSAAGASRSITRIRWTEQSRLGDVSLHSTAGRLFHFSVFYTSERPCRREAARKSV